ncbi:helicase [Ornithinibacillus xuwenensis]|uniref:Helicase n=1 Tax=Ornithinibacillus xuwenensis TaxID=3144668 RepID=A0ABU9XCW5_9BACI
MGIYPDCPAITRTIEVGGLTSLQLRLKLQQQSILLNEYAQVLLSDEDFTTSNIKYILKTVDLRVTDLGFPNGATLPQIFDRAIKLGLELCPIELGPHLRLMYLDQPEGHRERLSQQHTAPSGSITIASNVVKEDDLFPKGFYLSNINGVLWLRGYTADNQHIWNPCDHFIFCQTMNLY